MATEIDLLVIENVIPDSKLRLDYRGAFQPDCRLGAPGVSSSIRFNIAGASLLLNRFSDLPPQLSYAAKVVTRRLRTFRASIHVAYLRVGIPG
jgi:hypothetical protein